MSKSPSSTQAPSTRGPWIMLIVLTMLTTAGMTVVLPVMPFVVLKYTHSQTHLAFWVGVLETVNALCAFAVAPLLGGLSDRFGRRPIIIFAAFGSVIGYTLYGVGGALWVLLLGRIISGITAGNLPALFAYLADITPPKDRAKRFGLLGALSGVGTMIGPAAGGLLSKVSVDFPVFVTAGLAAITGLVSIFLLPESLKPENRSTKIPLTSLQPFSTFKGAFSRPGLRSLLLALAFTTLPFMMFVNNFSVLGINAINWDAEKIGLMTSCVGVIDIIIQGFLLRLMLPHLGERGVLILGMIIQACGLGALAVVGSLLAQPWLFVTGGLMLAAGEGGATATMNGALANSVGADEQGWLGGATQSLSSGIGALAPLLAGILFTSISHSAPYWLGMFLMLAAAFLVVTAKVPSPSRDAFKAARKEAQLQQS